MPKIANRNVRSLVQNRKCFKANNIFAEANGNNYVVFSYGYHYPMFAFVDNVWYENSIIFSVTTTKHKSQCRPIPDTVKLETNEIKNLLHQIKFHIR